MTNNQNFPLKAESENQFSENYIDIGEVFNSLKRSKGLIIKFGLAGLFLGACISLRTEKLWKGEFQIVLDQTNTTNLSSSFLQSLNSGNFQGLLSNNQNKSLQTQVGILKSPSVLLNVFEFVKNERTKNTDTNKSNLRFDNWNKSLDIQLENNTTILNIAYIDKDQKMIIPVLNRISSTYQEYSGKERQEGIELRIEFLKTQIQKFKTKSTNSLRRVQEFAIEQDLSLVNKIENKTGNKSITSNYINIEVNRIEAANQIRVIDQKLSMLENYKTKENIIFLAREVPALISSANLLMGIDSQLAISRLTFKENDKVIQELKYRKDSLTESLFKQVKGYLFAQRADAKSILKASERPQGVLIEYKQLLGNAEKDRAVLDELEKQYRFLLLEQAKNENPWELITVPKLLPSPVSVSRRKIIAFGLLCGLSTGAVLALISEKTKTIIST